MPCTVVVGGFWGDEGKGKIISHLAIAKKVEIGVRGGVGPNAGHTVEFRGRSFKLRMLPSTFVEEKCRLLIGAGVLVNTELFLEEVRLTNSAERAGLDPNCAIIEEKHREADKSSDYLSKKIGTTGTGTGPCNVDRVQRIARTARDVPDLSKYLVNVSDEVNRMLDTEAQVLLEGTQGTFLSLFHGTYPYCTSKDVTASSICSDVGIGPTRIDDVVIVFKAFVTRVGGGALPGELTESETESRGWIEIATVTGRKRRSAPFNFELAKKAVRLNSATQAAVTKLDVLFPECRGATRISELTKPARDFIEEIENQIKISVTLIGTGPETESIIDLTNQL